MKISRGIFALGSLLFVSQLSLAGTLVLSGTVPDRGYTIVVAQPQKVTITPNKNSELTVYISANAKPQRMPQSVEVSAPQIKNLQKENNWVKLTQNKELVGDYRVKVVAP